MNLPVFRTPVVFHIGTLNPAAKGSRFADSLEEHCLSVSHCPHAWRSIAKLGGVPLWKLVNPQGIFLDGLKAAKTKPVRNTIEAWGIDGGFVERADMWRAWFYDSEDEQWRYFLCASAKGAHDELEDRNAEDHGPAGGPAVEPASVLIGTRALSERTLVANLSQREAFDLLATVWAEDTQPGLDGVWWNEDYAPASLSAPRGGILPRRVPAWVATRCAFDQAPDDDRHKLLRAGYRPSAGVPLDQRGTNRPTGRPSSP